MNRITYLQQRLAMVEHHIAARGINSQLVLGAMQNVPREAFLPAHLHSHAYEDNPLPIAEGQTISQPYIVALMTDALQLAGGEKVMEIGTGSGYAAAVLGQIASEVYTVERIGQLAEKAATVLTGLGYHNIHVLHADGSLGWPEHAPYDAIIVAAGGPEIPESLKSQLAIGGRLVIPVGRDRQTQELVRVTRLSRLDFKTEDIADVRFVPLLGAGGWPVTAEDPGTLATRPVTENDSYHISDLIRSSCESFATIADADLAPLLDRIGNARIVLLGESSHGTSEFYRMRERISRELIECRGFSFIAIEGDWPDAARIDHHVRHLTYPASEWTAFARFPVWMWRNREVREFVDWLRKRNGLVKPDKRVAFYGLDLYSLFTSIRAVLSYLDTVDPDTAEVARERYGCLSPWQSDPSIYGHATLTGAYTTCEKEVVSILKELLQKQLAYAGYDGERFLDAVQNAKLIASAEQYYRIMYYGSRASWNLRDSHMFDTLKSLLKFHGPDSKAIVWAHNSHIGDSAATEMSARGEYNIGRLCRQEFGDAVYSIGFGTHTGTVAAASSWDAQMEIKRVRPSLSGSYERLCHDAVIPRFLLPLTKPHAASLIRGLSEPRLERAIGVIYRPDTELQSHYFRAVLPKQFDEYIWFDETEAVSPFQTGELDGLPDTYPFGL